MKDDTQVTGLRVRQNDGVARSDRERRPWRSLVGEGSALLTLDILHGVNMAGVVDLHTESFPCNDWIVLALLSCATRVCVGAQGDCEWLCSAMASGCLVPVGVLPHRYPGAFQATLAFSGTSTPCPLDYTQSLNTLIVSVSLGALL